MFNNLPQFTVQPSYYRKKSENDKGNERTGEYVFKFKQPMPVDIMIDLSELPKAQRDDIVQKLVTASDKGEQITLFGMPSSRTFNGATSHSLLVQSFDYKPAPAPKVANV